MSLEATKLVLTAVVSFGGAVLSTINGCQAVDKLRKLGKDKAANA